MGSHSPSKIRREGRCAFHPGENPMDVQPYKIGSWGFKAYLQDWMEGWRQAEDAYEESLKAEGITICPYCGQEVPDEKD